LIQEAAHEDANIIFGSVIDSSMKDEIKITVIATGFDRAHASMYQEPSRGGRVMQEPQYRNNNGIDPRDYPAYMRNPRREEMQPQPQMQPQRANATLERSVPPAPPAPNYRSPSQPILRAAAQSQEKLQAQEKPGENRQSPMDRAFLGMDDAEIDIPAFMRKNQPLPFNE
jgi:cell division protein FtsZ